MRICVVVYGRPDCPFTAKAVKELMVDHIPFSYFGFDANITTTPKFWQAIAHLTDQRTFPTIIVFENDSKIQETQDEIITSSSFTQDILDATSLTEYLVEKQEDPEFLEALGVCWANPGTLRVRDWSEAQDQLHTKFVYEGE